MIDIRLIRENKEYVGRDIANEAIQNINQILN